MQMMRVLTIPPSGTQHVTFMIWHLAQCNHLVQSRNEASVIVNDHFVLQECLYTQ